LGQIGELVDSDGVGVLGVGVVLLDFDEVSEENVLPVLLLSFLGVSFAVVTLELLKGVGSVGSGGIEAVKVD